MSQWNDYLVRSERSLFSQAHTHRMLIERVMLEVPGGARVLEAGCGLGYLSRLLADAGYRVTAGDLDAEVLATARDKLQSGTHAIDFVQLDLLDLRAQFAPGSFDVIVHSGVMEHFPDEALRRSFAEQRAVSKALVFKVPNIRTKPNKAHFGDERFLSNRHWVGLLREAGFQSVRVFGGESVPGWTQLLPAAVHAYPKAAQSPRKRGVLSMLSAWRAPLSAHSIFVCR